METTDRDGRRLRVDWIEPSSLRDARAGRLGLTFLPGKHGASVRYPGRIYGRDLDEDVVSLLADGVSVLVLLVEDRELDRWGHPDIVEVAGRRGLRIERWPMADGTAPATIAEMRAILTAIDDARDDGDVAVACMGGVGRTGTVVACALVAAGWQPAEAISEVRRVRHPTAVETAEQRDFVGAFARAIGRLPSGTVRT